MMQGRVQRVVLLVVDQSVPAKTEECRVNEKMDMSFMLRIEGAKWTVTD